MYILREVFQARDHFKMPSNMDDTMKSYRTGAFDTGDSYRDTIGGSTLQENTFGEE
jgi:hypothetical protein